MNELYFNFKSKENNIYRYIDSIYNQNQNLMYQNFGELLSKSRSLNSRNLCTYQDLDAIENKQKKIEEEVDLYLSQFEIDLSNK